MGRNLLARGNQGNAGARSLGGLDLRDGWHWAGALPAMTREPGRGAPPGEVAKVGVLP
jgi:hypothetical protein